jgi:methylenetetrahydrofolate--tRNA-(uracil-5-)-methyltransferase
VVPPPATTALGGVLTHLSRGARGEHAYQPSNVTWAWLPPLEDRRLKKRDRYEAMSRRALADLALWLEQAPLAQVA